MSYRGIREWHCRGTTQEDNAPSEHFGFQSHRRMNPLPPPLLSLHRFPLSPSFSRSLDFLTRRIIMFPVLIPRLRFPPYEIDLTTSSLANPSFLVEEFLPRVPSGTYWTAPLFQLLKKIRDPRRIWTFRNPRRIGYSTFSITKFPDD